MLEGLPPVREVSAAQVATRISGGPRLVVRLRGPPHPGQRAGLAAGDDFSVVTVLSQLPARS